MIASMKPPYDITPKILKLIICISEKIGEVNANYLTKQSPQHYNYVVYVVLLVCFSFARCAVVWCVCVCGVGCRWLPLHDPLRSLHHPRWCVPVPYLRLLCHSVAAAVVVFSAAAAAVHGFGPLRSGSRSRSSGCLLVRTRCCILFTVLAGPLIMDYLYLGAWCGSCR